MEARAVEALYREHGHSVLRRARRLLRNDDDAREVLQEVFAVLLDRDDVFRGESSITTWLYSATTNGCLNRMRNQKTRAKILDRHMPREETVDAGAEAAVIVRQLLSTVSDELARVAVYYYVDEMTHDEIARVLSCSRRHVGDLVERLLGSIRSLEGVT